MSLLRTARRAAGASAVHGSVHGRVQRRQQERWATPDQAAPAPTTPAPADTNDLLNQLERLGHLHKLGVLTDDEFAQKARLLG